jgi:hypothetical protein
MTITISTLSQAAKNYYHSAGINNAMNSALHTTIKGSLDMERYVILAGKEVRAYNQVLEKIETHTITKDMHFMESEIIIQPGSKDMDTVIRVALNKGDWTWMDVDRDDVLRVELKPMYPITRSMGGYGTHPPASNLGTPIVSPSVQTFTTSAKAAQVYNFSNVDKKSVNDYITNFIDALTKKKWNDKNVDDTTD